MQLDFFILLIVHTDERIQQVRPPLLFIVLKADFYDVGGFAYVFYQQLRLQLFGYPAQRLHYHFHFIGSHLFGVLFVVVQSEIPLRKPDDGRQCVIFK
ncbi:hypothetical protein Barb7_00299 [Bacteroidales bacterium Barb7]|nr:hypothetical protein Barb7_00299 [Bacteroidales bacterium Barb7]